MRALAAALLLALLAGTAGAQGEDEPPPAAAEEDARPQWGRGPLEVRDPYLLALLRLSPWARSPRTLGHLDLELGLRTVWSNSHAFQQDRFVIDGEVRRVIPYLRLGLFERFELGLHLPYEWRGGGELDGFIEGFHRAFGLPRQERHRRPRDRFLVAGLQSNRVAYRNDGDGYGAGDLIAEGRALLTAGGPLLPAAAATLRLRLPTGQGDFDLSDGVDASLGLDLSKRLGSLPLVLYAGGAYTYYAESSVERLRLTRHRGFLYLGAEWELLERLSFTVHGWVETPRETKLFRDSTRFPVTVFPRASLTYGNWVSYLAFGFQLEPVDGLELELGALQNLVDPETTADFSFLFNASLRL